MRYVVFVLALAAGLALPAAAQVAPGPGAVSGGGRDRRQRTGPEGRGGVPDFTLPDQDGRPRSLASLAGPKGTMLVFSRSADW